MNNIVNDTSVFAPISLDPTIKQEDRWIRKINKLVETNFLTPKECRITCRPTGSQPARLYGLPKVHKTGAHSDQYSVSDIYNFGVVKMLMNRLSHLRKHPTIILDTFSFVDQLHSLQLDMNNHTMISFDVVNLFTRVPLDDTITLIRDQLYTAPCTCHPIPRKGGRRKQPPSPMQYLHRRFQYEMATRNRHKGNSLPLQQQNLHPAQRSRHGQPPGPLLADIYLMHLENNWCLASWKKA